MAEVHVKTKGLWQIANIDKFKEATTDRVVFVELTEAAPEFFILEGDHARAIIGGSHDQWIERIGGVRPRTPDSKHSGFNTDLVQHGHNRWTLFN